MKHLPFFLKPSTLAGVVGGYFIGECFTATGVEQARAWVIWPIFVATGLICFAIENKE